MADASVHALATEAGTVTPIPSAVSESIVMVAGAPGAVRLVRTAANIQITPLETDPGTTESGFFDNITHLNAYPSVGLRAGDWAEMLRDDGKSQTIHSARWNGTAWKKAEEFSQGATMAGASTSWRWEDSDVEWPARYWNGVDTTVTNQKFSVDAAGNVVVGGTLAAGAIDVPGAGVSGFHVDATGNVGAGGTTATDANSEFLASAAGVVSARSATLYPKDSTAVALILKDDKSTSGNLFEARTVADAVRARIVAGGDLGRIDSHNGFAIFSPLTNAEPSLRLSVNALLLGAGGATPVDIVLARNAADVLTLGSAAAGTGDALELIEQVAPSTPAANRIRLYANSNSLWLVDETGATTDLGAGGGSVATDAIWDVKGDLAVGTGANTAIRLAVGANKLVLRADSTAASGASWGFPYFRGARLTNTVAQTIANNVQVALTFDTEAVDTDGLHSTATNTERITVPTGMDGMWLLTASSRFVDNALGYRYITFQKNGAGGFGGFRSPPAAGVATDLGPSTILDAVATDYFTVVVRQNSGGNLDVSAQSFAAHYLGPSS